MEAGSLHGDACRCWLPTCAHTMTALLPPTAVGIGLRAPHQRELLAARADLDFLEVHSENYFHAGGAALHGLLQVAQDYPLSLHGVGLSLGSADALADSHLDKLARLMAQVQPALVSEHLSWSGVDGICLNDLLPLPRSREALNLLADRIDHVQQRLGRRILVENLSAYVDFAQPDFSEGEWLAAIVEASGCGLLLDINNLYVNACNFGFDPVRELACLPAGCVGEYHLAGHTQEDGLLIDTHGAAVCGPVWVLYGQAVAGLGPAPTLIERDADLPPLATLLAEAQHARAILRAQAAQPEPCHA